MRPSRGTRPTGGAARALLVALLSSILVSPIVLSGCATAPVEQAALRPAHVRDAFEASGRLAVARSGEGFSGAFRWTAEPNADRVDLATPLGQTVARLESSAGGVRLLTGEGKTKEAATWEALTERELGWPLPVTGLRYWIQGAPRPGSAAVREPDAQGRVETMRQDGWEIVYRYRDDDMQPSGVRLTYPGVEVRIALDSIAP